MGKYRPSSHGKMGLRMGCEADGQHHLNWNARFGKEQRGRGPGQDPGLRLSGRDLLLQQQQGALLQELLDEKGVEWFLDAEADAIASVHCSHTVIAPGGSCICRERAIEHMRSLGTVVYLQLTLEEVEGRIHNMATRGIALQPGQTLADVYAYRTPLYEACAHLTVPVHNQSLAETVIAVQQALTQYK